MSNEAQNLSKLLHFTDSLCAFADDVAKYHDCQFNVEIDDDKFEFDLPGLVAEIRKYRQAVIDDIENFNDEITMSDFDDVRKDMPYTVKKLFDLMLPRLIIEEAKAHEKVAEPMLKETRIKTIETFAMLAMLKLIQIPLS